MDIFQGLVIAPKLLGAVHDFARSCLKLFDHIAFGALIRQKRGEMGLTQPKLALLVFGKESRKADISRFESGKKAPQEDTVQKLILHLGITEAEMAPIRQSRVTAKDLDNLPALDRDDLELLATRFQIADAPDLGIRQLRDLLHEKAKDYRALRKEVDDLKSASPRLANQHAAAMDALDNLRIEEAEEILANAREIVTEQLREPLEINAQLMEAQAEAALLRGKVREAYHLLAAASDGFAVIDDERRIDLRIYKYTQRLYDTAARYGGAGFRCALQLIEPVVTEDLRSRLPKKWAHAQVWLGIAHFARGQICSGQIAATHFGLSIAAYQVALTEFNKDENPSDWAMTQNNLAIALAEQGTRTGGEDGIRHLADAATAYRTALTVYTETDHPVDWAMTQNNLGTALADQGILTGGEDSIRLLAEAVAAYRAALTVRTQADHPRQWAMTQHNLGNALGDFGKRTEGVDGPRIQTEALDAYEQSLTVRNKDHFPVDWATTQECLAITRENIADHDATTDPRPHLEAALAHVEAALTVFDPEHMPYDYGTATHLRDRLMARLAALS